MDRRRRDWRISSSSPPANYKPRRPKYLLKGSSSSPENDNPIPLLSLQRIESVEDSCNPPSLMGTCPDTCPARERTQRKRLRDLSVFERLNGNPGRTSPTLAVKKFCRNISGMDVKASDIRPLPVLHDTLKYLFSLLESSEHPYEAVHDFVSDRTRSIRQDLGMRNIINDQAIHMCEEM